MFERRRCKLAACSLFALSMLGIVYLGYFCPDGQCALSSTPHTPSPHSPISSQQSKRIFSGGRSLAEKVETPLNRYDFNIDGQDVLVFLHIQKTGGSVFGRHLVNNLDVDPPCQCTKKRKRCDCHSKQEHIWLFSRYSTGWRCGLHADWTELTACVPEAIDQLEENNHHSKYRFLYITILRHPLQRYLSEWLHVRRGATWLEAKLKCNGRSATLEEVPFCFEGEDWSGVTLEGFMDCKHNLAVNRQTRMLADLSLVGCYDGRVMTPEVRDRKMLESAKQNLREMAFFGLTAYQQATQYMFERTFNLEFINDFEQRNSTHAEKNNYTPKQEERILDVNRLDLELYQYAEELFLQRLHSMQGEEQDGKNRAKQVEDPVLEYSDDDSDDINDEYEDLPQSQRRSRRRTSRNSHAVHNNS